MRKKKRQRTVFKCPMCEGKVISERLNIKIMFVVCEPCNAVVDYYDSIIPFVRKKKKILYMKS